MRPVAVSRRTKAQTTSNSGDPVRCRAALVTVQDRLRCGPFKLCAHFLQPGSKRFNLLLLALSGRFLLLIFAVLLQELVEQHGVHCVAHGVRFALALADN